MGLNLLDNKVQKTPQALMLIEDSDHLGVNRVIVKIKLNIKINIKLKRDSA